MVSVVDDVIEFIVKFYVMIVFYKWYLNRLNVFMRDDNGT